jgi:hypothetical protein
MNEQHDAPKDQEDVREAWFVETDPATYREQVGTIFSVDQPGPIGLQLTGVTDERVSGGIRQFSLFFHGPADRILPQGTYSFRHAALGSVVLFVVPVIGSNAERIVYQACFSVPIEARRVP